jgi:hypothetical protein
MRNRYRQPVARQTLQSAARRREPAPRSKALIKIVVLVALVNQILTTAFAFFAHQNHPDIALGLTILFSFGLCVILSAWIRSDAKNAWLRACEGGYVSPAEIRGGHTVRVRRDCPGRWLVVLHIELAGGLVASAGESTRITRSDDEI